MKKITKYFLEGLLYLAPLGITLYLFYAIFQFLDKLVKSTVMKVFNVEIPGLGLLLLVLAIFLAGLIGQTIIARPLKALFKSFVEKTPVLKVVYSAFDDLFSAFVGKDKKFNKPVLVKMNSESDLEKLGFLTEENLSRLGEDDKVAVYFPHSYNFSGELFIVPRKNIRTVNINPAQVMKFIVSAGVAGWDDSPVSDLSPDRIHKE